MDADGRVTGIQGVQAAGGVAQFLSQGGERGAGAGTAWAAATASARGRCAHKRAISATAAGSEAARLVPMRAVSSCTASSCARVSSLSSRAPSAAASPASWLRLVMMTMLAGLAGSSGRTWRSSRALSSTISIRRSASRLRYRPAWASALDGMRSGGTPSASRNPRITSAGVAGVSEGSKPRRFTYSCPSRNRPTTWCAQCSASAVLPTPAVPPIAEITTVPPPSGALRASGRQARKSSSAFRPVKCRTPGGSCRGTGESDSPAERA